MLVLPLTGLGLSAAGGQGPRQLIALALGTALLAALVLGWSAWQVRRGRWAHIDASQRSERRGLNRFLLAVLLTAALVAAWRGQSPAPALGLAGAAAMVAAGMLLAPWLKLSLHASFAVFSATLLSALGWGPCLLALAFAAAVAWSRWILGRHRLRELAAGAAAGGLAGIAFWELLRVAG